MREPALTQGARWTGSGLPAARRIACAFAAAAAFAPAGADAQRAPTPRESGGRGTILHYEEAGRANIVYFEETRGASSSAAAAKTPARTPRWWRAKYEIAQTQYKLGDKAGAAKLIRYLAEVPPGLEGCELKEQFLTLLQRSGG